MRMYPLMMKMSRKSVANRDIEELPIARLSKSALDKEIAKELKQGWQIKSRTHDSDGLHGVTLVRENGQLPGPEYPSPFEWR